jgi:hypothetical protein
MKPGTVLILRLAGLLIEVVCLALLFTPGVRGRTIAGRPVEWALYAGILAGFLIWSTSRILVQRSARTPPD